MEGNGGRNGRRNDSISSVMSLGGDNNNNNNNNNAPATNQRSSRAENTHLQDLDHQASVHMLSQYASHDTSFMDSSGASDTDQSMDMMSDQDIRNAIFELLDQLPITANTDLITPYERAAMLPPVTQDSLCELDVGRIINNPKLRHDVNFDRELHFRPNLDGYRGKQKLRSADEFWSALRAELEIYKAIGYRLMYSTSAEELEEATRMIKANQLRLPGVFTTIYEILKTLVPERDQAIVAERLDVDMIMQQITKGVFDLMDMTRWLSTILKAHCAPMRDEWIDRMVDGITTGVEQGDQNAVVFGLRQTLAILEAMKLDVANHQIRHLRSLLIDDTVNFQQKYHVHKIAANRFKVNDARAWFKDEEAFLNSCNVPSTPLETFASAAIRSLFSQSPLPNFPGTFYLDAERLRILRSDLHNVIQMDMCVNAFDLLIKNNVSASTRVASKKTLQANIADIIGEPRQYLENLENISAEIVRFVLQLEGATTTFDSDMMAIVELHLRAELSPSSPSLSAQLQTILNAQLPRFRNAVNSSSRLPLLALHDAMLPPVQSADKRTTQQVMVEPPLDEILKRVTHLAVLHWHVWSGIVYDIQADGPMVAPGSPGNNPDSPQTNPDTASPSSLASSPDMQSQSGGFAKHTGPSITNGRPQK